MPFEKITFTKITKTGKPLSAASVSLYKTRLNRIAQTGYDTIQSLVDNADEVIEILDVIFEKNDDVEKRSYYSAIFYALYERPNEDKKKYYDAFQKLKGGYNDYKKS